MSIFICLLYYINSYSINSYYINSYSINSYYINSYSINSYSINVSNVVSIFICPTSLRLEAPGRSEAIPWHIGPVVYVYLSLSLYIYIYIYICIHVYIHMYMYMYIYIYTYICMCVYIYIYIYTHVYVSHPFHSVHPLAAVSCPRICLEPWAMLRAEWTAMLCAQSPY